MSPAPALQERVDSVVLRARLADMREHARSRAGGLAGATGSDWEKLNRGGGDAVDTKNDYEVNAIPAGTLFSRKDLNDAYVAALDGGKAGSQVAAAAAKEQAHLVQALHRGTVVRYGRGRIWALAAAYARKMALSAGEQAEMAATGGSNPAA